MIAKEKPPAGRTTNSRTSRYLVGLLTSALLVAGGVLYWKAISADGATGVLEFVGLLLFCALFGWIAFSFSLATVGFIACLSNDPSGTSEDSGTRENLAASSDEQDATTGPTRTAILMPIFNESPAAVFAGMLAMFESLQQAGVADDYDFFVLSDSTQQELWLQEEFIHDVMVKTVAGKFPHSRCRLYYRHRSENKSRKSGNIAEFCAKWGDAYDFMIVLDADSLLEAGTMQVMVDAMRGDSMLGIQQVPPLPIGRTSLFARLQQFASDVHGPIYTTGFSRWAGFDGNYFGHNAILRVSAFKEHCHLPLLPGTAPLGGEILSHDFVEAALMLRGGFRVAVDSETGGSYEECPTTISDFAKRDQRWCQGNLQHARLIACEGFKFFSRLHFAAGVMSYCAAPIWIAFMAVTALDHLVNRFSSGRAAGILGGSAFPIAMALFIVSMLLLFLPKFFGLIVAWRKTEPGQTQRNRWRLLRSVLVEAGFAILLAPIMAWMHTTFVTSILLGRSVEWTSQNRGESGVTWQQAIRQYWRMNLLGLAVLVAAAWLAPEALFWLLPFLLGLILAIPLAVVAGSVRIGESLLRQGVLTTSYEISAPPIAAARDQAMSAYHETWESARTESRFERLIVNESFVARHIESLLATETVRQVSAETAEQLERTISARSIANLSEAERFAVLADPHALRSLVAAMQTTEPPH